MKIGWDENGLMVYIYVGLVYKQAGRQQQHLYIDSWRIIFRSFYAMCMMQFLWLPSWIKYTVKKYALYHCMIVLKNSRKYYKDFTELLIKNLLVMYVWECVCLWEIYLYLFVYSLECMYIFIYRILINAQIYVHHCWNGKNWIKKPLPLPPNSPTFFLLNKCVDFW